MTVNQSSFGKQLNSVVNKCLFCTGCLQQTSWNRCTKSPRKLWNAPKTPVWNTPRVKRHHCVMIGEERGTSKILSPSRRGWGSPFCETFDYIKAITKWTREQFAKPLSMNSITVNCIYSCFTHWGFAFWLKESGLTLNWSITAWCLWFSSRCFSGLLQWAQGFKGFMFLAKCLLGGCSEDNKQWKGLTVDSVNLD